jgi:ABC-type bacteriocin/lantibiotic exporter with double-glycine peptidase domain
VERRAVERWSNLFTDSLNASVARGRLNATFEAVMSGLSTLSPLIILIVGSLEVLQGRMSLGSMLALNALAMGFIGPLSSLASALLQFQLLGSYLTRIADVLEADPEQYAEAVKPAPTFVGRITLDDVSFRYSRTGPLVVKGVSAEIHPGQQVALVGRSGSGKSTLARLLIGLYAPSSGRILLDGIDIRGLESRSVRNQVGIVTQLPRLFEGTIRSNIALANPNLPLDRVIEAAMMAHVHNEIVAMPMGYETIVTEGGSSLSGGQRQRLALARALINRPRLLLLDEATSQLDAITEFKIQETLDSLDTTRVICAHRLSTVIHSGLILVLDGGAVAERGTHEDLLKRGGLYAELISAQLVNDTPPSVRQPDVE